MRYLAAYAMALLIIALTVLSIGYATTITSLTIRVYKDDKPVENAVLELWANNTLIQRGVTDGNGTVSFTNITTGDYAIYVYINGSVYRFDKAIDANTTELNLTLSGVEGAIANVKSAARNWYLAASVGAAFIVLVLIAYALSGKRIPRRR